MPVTRSMKDRVVLVTGGSAGIGRAIATRLASEGARVVLCARDEHRVDSTVRNLPGAVSGIACDITDVEQRARLIDHVVSLHGRIDALVNNAGQGRIGLFTDLDAAEIDDVVAVNVVAVADLTRRVLRHVRGNGGDIVMISSLAAWVPVPPLSLYSATKAAINGLVSGLRRETPRSVRVHSVNPGPVRTEWLLRAAGLRPSETQGSRGRSFGTRPDKVADAVHACLTGRRQRTLTVPRWLGVSRIAALPPVDSVVSVAMAPAASLIAWWARRHQKTVVSRARGPHPDPDENTA